MAAPQLQDLSTRIADAVVRELEKAGAAAGLPSLRWQVHFDSGPSYSIEGWCSDEAEAGIEKCQRWVETAKDLDWLWDAAKVGSDGIWTASGYLGGVDVSVSCVADPQAFEKARRDFDDYLEAMHGDEV